MKDRLLHTPEGVRDIYNSECGRKLALEKKIQNTMKLYAFDYIQTPTFEYFDIFSEERGTVKAKDMYKLFDREGNTLVLRPDMTPSIARCVAKYYKEVTSPIRLAYNGNTFINSSEYQGKQKEVTQLGAELINDADAGADAEMLALTIDCLLEAGLSEFQVEVGQVQFFKALIKEAGFEEEQTEQLRALIVEKNIFGLENFLNDMQLSDELKTVFSKLPQLFGGIEKLAEIKKLTSNKDAIEAVERLEAIYELMKLYGYERYIGFDLGMLSQYGYYTGIIFHAFTYGIGDAVISGGRYDALVGQFGKDAPAIGMAIILDRLMLALSRQGIEAELKDEKTVVEVGADYSEAIKKVISLRRNGKSACIGVNLD